MSHSFLRIGPSGWDFPHWQGTVYPKHRQRGFHPLEFLSCYFDTVEIARTFHSAVRPEVSRLWLAKVVHNPDFVFTARLHRRFTHDRVLKAAEVGGFKDGLWPLLRAGRFGSLLLQFPWSFRFTEENREFLIQLRRTFYEFPMTVEMRHASWMADEALGTLVDYRLGFSNIDQPAHMRAMPPTAFVTSQAGYACLHGRNPRYWQAEFRGERFVGRSGDYLYSPAELEEWKARIEHIARHANSTFVILTNDAAGKAVVNAMQLQSLLGVSKQDAPAELRRLYGSTLSGSRTAGPVQKHLFREPARAAVA